MSAFVQLQLENPALWEELFEPGSTPCSFGGKQNLKLLVPEDLICFCSYTAHYSFPALKAVLLSLLSAFLYCSKFLTCSPSISRERLEVNVSRKEEYQMVLLPNQPFNIELWHPIAIRASNVFKISMPMARSSGRAGHDQNCLLAMPKQESWL